MSKKNDTWLQKYWRPMMAVVYMAVILFDFIIAPILWSILQAVADGIVTSQWSPLTLLSGGVFHAAMGAVLGISAFTRGQEKLERLRSPHSDDESAYSSTEDSNSDR